MARSHRLPKSSYLIALLSGLGFAAAFPPSPFDWLAWFSVVPLFALIEDKNYGDAFRIGWIWGIAHFTALVYWIVVAVGHYGKMSPLVSIAPMGLLALYLALYPAIFCSLTTWLRNTTSSFLWVPLLWVALEYGRAKLLSGFPWCLAGYSQYNHPLLTQVSDLSGVYGLSYLVILVNWTIYRILLAKDRPSILCLGSHLLFTCACVLAILGYGHQRLNSPGSVPGAQRESFKIAIIQPSIDQSVKWDPRFQDRTMKLYETLTRKAAESGPDLIIWPETATPFFFQSNNKLAKRVRLLSRQLRVPIVFGSPAYEESSKGTKYFNRAYLLKPEGTTLQYYDKVHLVPFGEYVPLERFLSFIGKLVPGAGSFSPGSSIRLLNLNGYRLGVLICFEAIFPDISRVERNQGAHFLVNLTNDAWFGKSSAPYQHLAMSIFRAVENRLPLVRAANTGFSAIVDCFGRVKKKSGLFTKEILVGTINIDRVPPLTFYARHGDLFALASVLLSCISLGFSLLLRKS